MTAYEVRISDWSSDVCSSDLCARCAARVMPPAPGEPNNGFRQLRQQRLGQPHRAGNQHGAADRRDAGASGDLHPPGAADGALDPQQQIGKAECRESVCHYVTIQASGLTLQTKKKKNKT